MFQRTTPRQAGFIRTRNNCQNRSMRLDGSFTCQDGFDTLHFSPFKDTSPDTIQCIIQTYHLKQNKMKKPTKFVRQDGMLDSSYVRKNPMEHFQNTPKANLSKQYSVELVKDQIYPQQEVSIIGSASVDLSLAEAFSTRCKRMKEKLEYQRKKYSRPKKDPKSQQKAVNNPNCTDLKKRNSDPEGKRNIQKVEEILREEEKDKENNPSRINSKIQGNGEKQIRIDKKNNLSVKFCIPAQSSKSRPITPREAYQHSLKKWKQLPEVVAREKEKAKERELRERLFKMRAHSQEVRNKLRH